jgi:ketosteroid isomerase-like protein
VADPTGDETAEADRDTVRRVFEAWNRHDVEGIVALCHPGVRFHTLIGALEGSKAHRGHDGVRHWWAEVQGVFDDRHMDIEEITTRGEWVVCTGVGLGTGRVSGAEVRWPFVGVARLADGLLSEWRLFAEPKDARAFLGDSA